MPADFVWRGGSDLGLATDWTDAAAGAGPSLVLPGSADAATIDSPAEGVTGAIRAGTLTLAGGAILGAAVGGIVGLFAPVGGDGTLEVASGATLFDARGSAAGVSLAFAGVGATLDLAGSIAGPIDGFTAGDGIDLVMATLTGASWSSGTLTLTGPGATETLALPGSFAGQSFLVAPDPYGGSLVSLGTPTLLPAHAATLMLDGAYGGSGSVGSVTATSTVMLAGSLSAGSLTVSGQFAVLAAGTLDAGTLTLAGALDILGAAVIGSAGPSPGTLTIAPGATAAGNGRITADLACTGMLSAGPGTLALFGDATGSGTLAIGAGARLFLADAVSSGLTVDFAGAGATLDLGTPAAFAGRLAGLAAGDVIDLDFATGLAGLPIAAQLGGRRLITTTDGTGGTLLTIPCYASGTHLATPAGEAPVEALRPGDTVLAWRDGAWRAERIRWVGRITLDLLRHRAPACASPVCIAAHAFAAGLPRRDLLLSPEHAVFIDGALIQAQALLNGATVTQLRPARITYCHVELDRHALLLAEGVAAESYLDTGNRAAFSGTAPPSDPAAAAAVWDARACAPLLLGGARVGAVQARLLARAEVLGWRTTADPGLRAIRDGGTLRLRSRSFVPAWRGLGPDRRRLGVAVAALRLGGKRVAAAAFGAGWHAPERGLRWTDGDAVLHLPRPGRLTLRRAPIAASYWLPPPGPDNRPERPAIPRS